MIVLAVYFVVQTDEVSAIATKTTIWTYGF